MLVGPIKADLGLTDTEISLLHGLAFALFYTVFGIWPIGTWADKGNRRNIVAGGVFLWSLMTALCGRMTNFVGLFAARVGVGVGEAALTPTAYSMLADYFHPRNVVERSVSFPWAFTSASASPSWSRVHSFNTYQAYHRSIFH